MDEKQKYILKQLKEHADYVPFNVTIFSGASANAWLRKLRRLIKDLGS